MSAVTATGKTSNKLQFRLSTFILLCGVGPALAYWLIAQIAIGRGCGDFELRLDTHSRSGRAIQLIEYEAHFGREVAEYAVSDPAARQLLNFDFAALEGTIASCDVPHSHLVNAFGHDLSYTYAPFLVLRITYDDGEQALQLVEVPQGRGARSMTLEIP